jgi:hypothetical protein
MWLRFNALTDSGFINASDWMGIVNNNYIEMFQILSPVPMTLKVKFIPDLNQIH